MIRDKAFSILAENYRSMLMTYIYAITGSSNTADDLTQETLLAAYKGFDKFKKGEDFGAWLRGIARNKTLMERRSESRRLPIVDDRVLEGIEDVYSTLDRATQAGGNWSDKLEVVKECSSRLTETLKNAVREVYYKGKTLSEAATILNTSPATIAKRVSRARELIKKCVQRHLQGA